MLQLTGSRLIAANTFFSYSRTLISIVLALFSSRWVLEELGTVDFGLYSLIGSILAIVIFLNKVLANGDARFFAIGIGKNDQTELNKVFNTLLSLHITIPFIVTIIGFLIGEFIIRYYLVIPPERLQSSLIIFRISIFVSLLTMMTVPFSALFVANQNILESSLISLLQTFLMFICAYALKFFSNSSDKLIIYSIMISLVYIIVSAIMVVLSCRKYECTKIKTTHFFNRRLSSEVLKFSSWNMMADIGHLIRTQGSSIIVNLYWGPSGNAALGIATQVAVQSANLTNAMNGSTSPEIYRRAGEGKYQSAMDLSNLTSKIGLFLFLLVGYPILFNLDDLLRLWLVNVPTGTRDLCECFIYMFMIMKMTIGQLSYLNAIGKVALVNILILLFYSLSVFFPFCGLIQLGIVGIGISCILSMFLSRCSILYCMRKYTNFNFPSYMKTTAFPAIIIILVLLALRQLKLELHSDSFIQLILNGLFVLVPTAFTGFLLLFNKMERSRIIHLVVNKRY